MTSPQKAILDEKENVILCKPNTESRSSKAIMRKSKYSIKETMLLSQKLSSMKEKMSLKDVSSSRMFSKTNENHDPLFKLMDFDNVNNFHNYFPENNSEKVIPKLKYDFNNNEASPRSNSSKKKRNNGRNTTKTKTVLIKKETIINDFDKKTSLLD